VPTARSRPQADVDGPTLELEGVTRVFGGVVAVDAADLTLAPRQIHAVIGENGAGKSTLMKLAAGALAPTSGVVKISGRALDPPTAAEAIGRGVGMVYQHFMLCGAFRALENLVLGGEPTRAGGLVDFEEAARRARDLMARTGLDVPLDAVTDELTVGERQRLEILRVLFRGARAILLDEPTAVLSPLESEELYATLRRLAEGGATVAVVTHRLDEVVRNADRVTVMRKGRVVLRAAGRSSEEELARAIMGGEAPPPFAPPPLAEGAEPVLEIEGLTLAGPDGRAVLNNLDLAVRAGEIVGVAGIEGNGQKELVRAIAGLEPRATGFIRVAGRDARGLAPAERRRLLGVVHEDRQVDGLMLDATVADNLVLGELDERGLRERFVIERRIERFDVRPPDPRRLARELSGGNQQKIVLARAIDRIAPGSRAALVLAQPTRGVDVGAARGIHGAIGEAAKRGLATLVVSADLAELKRLAHRIVVLHRGTLVASFERDAPDAAIGRAMLGMEAA
jgi:general nucleoside transport system ATP-binding protein